MCFHLLILISSDLPIKFPASFHQIFPFVYKASYSTPAYFFLSIDPCFFKVVTPPRLVISFFPDSFPSIFNWMLPTSTSFHTLLIGSSLTNAFLHYSFELHFFQSVLTFRPPGFSTFCLPILSFDWMNIHPVKSPYVQLAVSSFQTCFSPSCCFPAFRFHRSFSQHLFSCPVKLHLRSILLFIPSDN
jgi:hypothetical protein